jgi:hypothetical protein
MDGKRMVLHVRGKEEGESGFPSVNMRVVRAITVLG